MTETTQAQRALMANASARQRAAQLEAEIAAFWRDGRSHRSKLRANRLAIRCQNLAATHAREATRYLTALLDSFSRP